MGISPGFNLADFFAMKASISSITRNKTTKHYKYADLNAISEAIAPQLGQRWVFQDFIENQCVVTRLYDTTTEGYPYIESSIEMSSDNDGQETGKLITYYSRYNRVRILDLVTEDDDAAGVRGRAGRTAPDTAAATTRTRTARTRRTTSDAE
jgi:hypothetical protein